MCRRSSIQAGTAVHSTHLVIEPRCRGTMPGKQLISSGGGLQIARLPCISNSYTAVSTREIMKSDGVKIPRWLWFQLIRQLCRRGEGERESGAFLLGQPGASRISAFVCYDDLDPTALDTGIIVFHGAGFVSLWDICRRRKMRVIADIHTHEGRWTGQSEADRTHPMVGQKGHISLIAPYYAQRSHCSLRGVGTYQYLGNHQWDTCPEGFVRLSLF